MYNIIDHLKNNKYFVVVLACVVVVLFLNSRTIVEGLPAAQRSAAAARAAAAARSRATAAAAAAQAQAKVVEQQTPALQKVDSQPITSQPITSQPITSQLKLTTAIRQEINKQIENQVDKQLKFQVDKEINKTVPTLIEQKSSDINRRITGLNDNINNLKTSNINMEEYIKNATSKVDGQIRDGQAQLVNKKKELTNNLRNQYRMHKNGLEQLSGTATNSIQTAASDIKNMNQETIKAKDEAQKFMGMSEDIYNKTLNLSTGIVIKNDINARESFATLNHFSAYDNVKESFDVYTNPTGSGNLFDLEKDVIDKLNDFNQVYYDYIKCSAEKSKCVSGATIANVNLKAQIVQDAIANLQRAYGANKSSQTIVSDASFNQIHSEIITKSQSINDLRTELDSKMQKIFDTNNRIGDDFNNYDSTVYAGIAWSILATSLVFFVFTEM